MLLIDRVRFREAVRIGPEELYYAYNGGVKEYKILVPKQFLNHGAFVLLNDVYVPMQNVTQFTLCPTVKPK